MSRLDAHNDSDDNIDIVGNELAILERWKTDPNITTPPTAGKTDERGEFTICSYPCVEPFTLSHTKLLTSVIKDVLLRMALCDGRAVKVIDSVKEDVMPQVADMQITLERLGCLRANPRLIPANCVAHTNAVLSIYHQLCKMNMIYRKQRIMAYCIGCRAPLSNFERSMCHATRLVPHAQVSFPLKDRPDVHILVAMKSLWTLAVNWALCVHPSSQYVEVRVAASNETFIIAENCVQNLFPANNDDTDGHTGCEVLNSFRGEQLYAVQYVPVFECDTRAIDKTGRRFCIICDELVDSTDGTGIIPLAPQLNAAYYDLCVREKVFPAHLLSAQWPLDAGGKFTEQIDNFGGSNVFHTEKAIIMLAKANGRLRHTESRLLEVATCLRCGSRLIEKPVLAQFIDVKAAIGSVRRHAAATKWCPDFIHAYRMNEWLEHGDDWAISCFGDNGIPIPLPGDEFTSSSSSSSPAIEVFHSSFEHVAALIYNYCANANGHRTIDCIAENCREAHPWFYTLLTLSTLIMDKWLVSNVIVTDMVLKKTEDDMTVRTSTAPPIHHLLSAYGADAYRLHCINSIIKRESRLALIEIELDLLSRDIIRPLYTALRQFSVQPNSNSAISDSDNNNTPQSYTFDVQRLCTTAKGELDKWILSLYGQLVADIKNYLDNYHLTEVIAKLVDFVQELVKWYIHLNGNGSIASPCYKDVLFYVLSHLAALLWPITPYLSTHMRQTLLPYNQSTDVAASAVTAIYHDAICVRMSALQMAIEQMKSVIDMAKAIRHTKHIPIAQRLTNIIIIHTDDAVRENIAALKSYILTELNVGQMTTGSDTNPYHMRLKAKPIYARLHKRPDYKALAQYIRKMTEKHIQKRLLDGDFCKETRITMNDVSLDYVQKGNCEWNFLAARSNGALIVLLDTQLTDVGVQRMSVANEIIGYVTELRNLLHQKRHNFLRIFYTLHLYSSDKQAMASVKSIIEDNLVMIETAIRTTFRVLRNEQLWKTMIEEEYIVLGAKLKIYICRP